MARLTGNIILTLFLLLSFSNHSAIAQITGTIIDSSDGQPVIGATVSDFYGRVLTKADTEGRFMLPQNVVQRVIVTSVGYKRLEHVFQKGSCEAVIMMEPEAMQLEGVTVKAKREKYRRKDNPAVELMRKVIAAKRKTDLQNKDYYQYKNYQKISAGFNDLKQEDLQRGIFKNRPWLNNHLEVSQYNNKLTLPITVEETVMEKLYRKLPRFEKDIVRGHRISGVSNLFQTGEIINVILKDFFCDIDIYDNEIRFLHHAFSSPIGRDAITFYYYYITDTVIVERDSCYQVDFFPANQQDFGFKGKLFVMADGSYQVRRCEMSFPKSSDVNWIDNMRCIQEFMLLDTGEWVLGHDDMIAEMKITKNAAKAIIIRNTRRSDYSFSPLPDSLMHDNKSIISVIDAEKRPFLYWEKYRNGTMTRGEYAVDSLVTEMYKIRGFKYLMVGMKMLFENFIETGGEYSPSKFDIGPVFSTVSSNFYDGLRLRLGGQTTANLHPHLFLKGYYAHAFKSKENYYDTQLIYSFNSPKYQPYEFPKRTLTFESMRDVALPSDKFIDSDKDNVFTSVKTTDIDKMFLYNRQSVRFDYEWLNGFKLYGETKTEEVKPLGNIAFKPMDRITQLSYIRYSEGTIGLRYAPDETHLTTKQQRWAINYSSPIIRLQHTKGFEGLLGGQYNYNYTEFELTKPFWLPMGFGCIESRLLVGIQWNQVPFPLLIMPATNVSIYKSKNIFDLINNMEFLTDRFLSWELIWDLQGKLFNRIPLLKKMKCRECLGLKCLWGNLSDKNNPYLTNNVSSNILMPFPDGSYIMNPNNPYWEFSVGVHNILNILHVEYIRRLNYLDLPTANKQAVKFALEFKF